MQEMSMFENKKPESESEMEQVADLARLISERKKMIKAPLHEILTEFETRGLVPERAVLEISRRMQKYEQAGASKEVLRLQAEDAIKDAVTMYRDERFEISNFNFFKAELFGFVDQILVEDKLESIDDLDKTAMIFFDVDGLKAVNDNALKLHTAGDIYLKKIAQALNAGRTTKWLESLGMEISPARRSGDEFMYAIRADKPLTKKTDFVGIDGENIENATFADYIIAKIKEDISELDMKDVQDFSDPQQREKYKDAVTENWPEDFEFRASISGGAASLLDAIKVLSKEKGNIDDSAYEELVLGILGKMINISDNAMLGDKTANKEKRKNSDSENDRLLEAIYRSARNNGKNE